MSSVKHFCSTMMKRGLHKVSKYLMRKRKADRDVSVSSEDNPLEATKRMAMSNDDNTCSSDTETQHTLAFARDSYNCYNSHTNETGFDTSSIATTSSQAHISTYFEFSSHRDAVPSCASYNIQDTCFSDTSKGVLQYESDSEYSVCASDINTDIDISMKSSDDNTSYISDYCNEFSDKQSSCDIANSNNEDSTDDELNEKSRFVKLQRLLKKQESNDIINTPVVVSEAEVLLAILKISNKNHLSQSAIAELYSMINTFFSSKAFPSSRYLIDNLFNCDKSLDYHAVCPFCQKYISKFDRQDRLVKCTLCNIDIDVRSPTYTHFFVIIDITYELTNLLQDNSETYESVIKTRMEVKDTFTDFIDGRLYKKFMQSLPENDRTHFVSLTVNSDGSPVFESSKVSIWPIQVIVNELPFDIRISRPLVAGLWFGKKKPDMNIYFGPYVDRMTILANEGIYCKIGGENRNIRIFTLCCCVDSGARPAMQGLVQYNGYYGCPWCFHEGVYIVTGPGKGCVKYPLLDELPRKRNEFEMLEHMRQSLTSRYPVFGVKRPSVLINLPGLNIVDGFVSDSMHQANEGLGAQFLNYWDSSDNLYSLSPDNIAFVNRCIEHMKVPNQVQRLTRSITERSWWKAREYENWILHYSVPILLSFPHMTEYVEHWMLFVGAYYILLKETITTAELIRAHEALLLFMKDTERLYLPSSMTFNVHQVQHLVQSVLNWGPFFAHSGYCFENGNGQIIKTIQAAKGVPHQICRSLAMKQSELILKKHVLSQEHSRIIPFISCLENKTAKSTVTLSDSRYFGTPKKLSNNWKTTLHLSDRVAVYRKMVKQRCLYTSSKSKRIRSDNSYATTKAGRFVRIHSFIVDYEKKKEYVLCQPLEASIVNINASHIFEVVKVHKKKAIETNTLKSVCIYMDVGHNAYISTLPNLYHY